MTDRTTRTLRETRSTGHKRVTIDSSPEAAFRHLDADAIVCVDVMLSATTLVTAASQGRRAFVAATEAAARALTATLPGACLMGPADGARPESPTALEREPRERPLVLWSPPGTELMVNASSCRSVLVASFRNLGATADHLADHRDVAVLGAGCREEFSCEDQMAAAWISARLTTHGFEPADRHTASLLKRWAGIDPGLAGWGNSAEALRRARAGEDLEFVLCHVDDLSLACEVRRGEAAAARRLPAASRDAIRGAATPGDAALAGGGWVR
jgi:phosphosulfolactate phosphohydrolase-like enzyme